MSIVRRTIRFRVTALAVVLSAALLVGVAILMTSVLRWQLADNLDEGIAQRADTIAAVIAKSVPPQIVADEDLVVQVVDPNGVVIGSSTNLAGAAAITPLGPGFHIISDVPGRTESFRVLVRQVTAGSELVTLIVGVNNDDVDRTRHDPGAAPRGHRACCRPTAWCAHLVAHRSNTATGREDADRAGGDQRHQSGTTSR